MNPRIRWVGGIMLLCFILLFVQLNNIQVRQAPALRRNPLNKTGTTPSVVLPRGEILSSEGYVLAESKPVHNSIYKYRRIYPSLTAGAFAPITGYYDSADGGTVQYGIEASYDQYLAQHTSPAGTLGQLLTQHEETDTVQLTVSEKLQVAAYKALAAAGQPGSAVVLIDPRNGDVLAMAEYPTYDPNVLARLNPAAVHRAFKHLVGLPFNANPLYNIATDVPHPPGSTFKTITTSAIYDHDASVAAEIFPTEVSYTFPNSGNPPQTLHNYASSACGGDLAQVLLQSCDTAYSQIGVQLGPENLALEANAFGLNDVAPIDLPRSQVFPSCQGCYGFPSPSLIGATPYTGFSAIGQFDDKATALQMALVVAGLADNGVIMKPHLVSRVVGSQGVVELDYKPQVWRRATSAATANKVRNLMLGVTENPAGTAYGVFQQYGQGLPPIAAKTGTAEPQKNVCGTYNWLVAFGPAGTGETPSVAGAAIVPIPSNSSSCQTNPTGASVAGPALIPLLRQALELNP